MTGVLGLIGYLRKDVYGKLCFYLKPKGKAMLARAIKNFQRAYKLRFLINFISRHLFIKLFI